MNIAVRRFSRHTIAFSRRGSSRQFRFNSALAAAAEIEQSSTPPVQMMSNEVNAPEYRKTHQINVRGDVNLNDFKPVTKFEHSNFTPRMVEALKKQGYEEPTPIQAQSWPLACGGRDIISVARTGSGKTVGFLLPAIDKILKGPTKFGARRPPKVLILAPTRELAIQIEGEAKKFCGLAGLSSLCIYGGASKYTQMRALDRGVDILIATPGRCNDLLKDGCLKLTDVGYFVLDEADRMLDMGFEPQIQDIIKHLKPERQNLFFTATWPKQVQHLASSYINNAVTVQIGDVHGLNANKNITQHIHMLTRDNEKFDKVSEILEQHTPKDAEGKPLRKEVPKVLIFVAKKGDCDEIALQIRDMGYAVGSLHGDKVQSAREIVLEKYRNSVLKVLVATDVAARGIDIKDIEMVINFDFPLSKSGGVEDYVHRIGRTARGNATGIAHTFFMPSNYSNAADLLDVLRRSDQVVPGQLEDIVEGRRGRRNAPSGNNRYRSSSSSQGGFDDILSTTGGGSSRYGGGNNRFGGRNMNYSRSASDFNAPRRNNFRQSQFEEDDVGSGSRSQGRGFKKSNTPFADDDDYDEFQPRNKRGKRVEFEDDI